MVDLPNFHTKAWKHHSKYVLVWSRKDKPNSDVNEIELQESLVNIRSIINSIQNYNDGSNGYSSSCVNVPSSIAERISYQLFLLKHLISHYPMQ